MMFLEDWLVAAAVLMTVASIFGVLWVGFLRRGALQCADGVRGGGGAVALTALAGLLVFEFVVSRDPFLTGWVAPALVLSSVSVGAVVAWAFAQSRGSEERAVEVLSAVVGVLEAGDPNLDGHSLHVLNLSMLIYRYLPVRLKRSLNPFRLQFAALLLDVGKLGVPRDVLDKAGRLSREEWELVRRHPDIAVDILSPIQSFGEIARWIQCHHERVDGAGYHSLPLSEIPLASRVIAVADTFSALTMDRSYKAALSCDEARSELRLAAGSQLDEEVVEAFCSIPLYRLEECREDVRRRMERYQSGNFR